MLRLADGGRSRVLAGATVGDRRRRGARTVRHSNVDSLPSGGCCAWPSLWRTSRAGLLGPRETPMTAGAPAGSQTLGSDTHAVHTVHTVHTVQPSSPTEATPAGSSRHASRLRS